MSEIWKDISKYEGLYLISNLGRIKSIKNKKNKILKPISGSSGYFQINLYKNNKMQIFLIHRLIALHFIPNPFGKLLVLHKNDVKTDNRIENLYWGDQKDNSVDAKRNGILEYGEKHSVAKLSEKEVVEIINLLKTDIKSREIANNYNIHESTINAIAKNRIWSYIKRQKIIKTVKGSKVHSSKLIEKNIYEILDLIKSGLKDGEIAKKYNVNKSVINRIKNNKSWKHIERI